MPRDTQRKRLYASERATTNVLELELRHEFGWGSAPMTTAECQAYITKVMRSQWLRKKYGPGIKSYLVTIVHSPQAHRGRASRGQQIIYTGGKNPNSRTTRYLLHELAHILDASLDASHGPTFCMIYLDLVRHFLGKTTHDVLLTQMKALKLRVKPKVARPKRVLTEDQKDALRARLEKARAAKVLKQAERAHAERLQEYARLHRISEQAREPQSKAYYAREAESMRESVNRLYERIGNLKYAMAKQEQADADAAPIEEALRAAGITL